MKKTYETPGMYIEEFMANEYVATCALTVNPTSKSLKCDKSGLSHNGGCKSKTNLYIDANLNVTIKEGTQEAFSVDYSGLNNISPGTHSYTITDISWTTENGLGWDYNHSKSSLTISLTASRNAS